MGGLVDNLLSLARLDEGRPLELADVDLTQLAADAVTDARAVEPDRPISLIAQKPVHIVGDETALRQVLANLLANAREHTPPGTKVEIRVAATTDGARLDIVDDGAGLDPDERARVFDRFWRGGNRTRSRDGSGLGLAIVAATAEAHGGRCVGSSRRQSLARRPFRRRAARPTTRLTALSLGRFGGLFSQVCCNFEGCHAQVALVLLTE